MLMSSSAHKLDVSIGSSRWTSDVSSRKTRLECSKGTDAVSTRNASATADGIILRVSSIREL